MRVEGAREVRPIQATHVVARLHDVTPARVGASTNRFIAAGAGVSHATAAAPTRRLTAEETQLLELLRRGDRRDAPGAAARAYASVELAEASASRLNVVA